MSFSKKVKRFQVDALGGTAEIRRGIILELFKGVVKDTPVDEGRARGNWQVSLNKPKTNEIDRLDKKGTAVIQEITDTVTGGDITHYLTNNVKYAVPLEYGHSGQAPQGMVRRNMARIDQNVKNQARKNKK